MERFRTEETAVDDPVAPADEAVVSPTIDFLVLSVVTLVAASALVVLL